MKVTITIIITLTLSTATALTAATVKEEGTPIAINKQQPTANNNNTNQHNVEHRTQCTMYHQLNVETTHNVPPTQC
jgi:hypothetical protein